MTRGNGMTDISSQSECITQNDAGTGTNVYMKISAFCFSSAEETPQCGAINSSVVVYYDLSILSRHKVGIRN